MNLIKTLSDNNYNTVITIQRFNSIKSASPYGLHNYNYSHTRYRLNETNRNTLIEAVKPLKNVYLCDEKELGCSACGLCAKLTSGIDMPVASLNLSTSGVCKFNCVDCYAKTMQRFLVGCGHEPIKFDVIKMNTKQKGTSKHILSKKGG
jgi:hypothetical protein